MSLSPALKIFGYILRMQSICVANRDPSFFYINAQVACLTFARQVEKLADVNFPKQSSAHIVRFSF